MRELQELAGKLLSSGEVGVVIGWEEGPRGVRPAFVTDPAAAGRLIFDPRCVQNLVTYLSPRRGHVAALGRPAVVVKGCDARAAAFLIRESQLRREGMVLLGVRCGGVLEDPAAGDGLSAETVADRCAGCEAREPRLADHLVGELPPAAPVARRREERTAWLEGLDAQGRFAFWREEFSRCLRCHACREICPLCFCRRCIAEKTQPAWIESSPHPRGNFAWHIVRALHRAGRCADCGECERACPAGIPLGLLNRQVNRIVEERFGWKPTDDPEIAPPIGTYRQEDAEEFIE